MKDATAPGKRKLQRRTPQPQYSYAERGKKKLSVPVSAGTDKRLVKMARSRKLSKATLAADLLAEAVA